MENLKKLGQNQTPLKKCEICDKEFKNTKGLNYHFNITHNLEKEYQCITVLSVIVAAEE